MNRTVENSKLITQHSNLGQVGSIFSFESLEFDGTQEEGRIPWNR